MRGRASGRSTLLSPVRAAGRLRPGRVRAASAACSTGGAAGFRTGAQAADGAVLRPGGLHQARRRTRSRGLARGRSRLPRAVLEGDRAPRGARRAVPGRRHSRLLRLPASARGRRGARGSRRPRDAGRARGGNDRRRARAARGQGGHPHRAGGHRPCRGGRATRDPGPRRYDEPGGSPAGSGRAGLGRRQRRDAPTRARGVCDGGSRHPLPQRHLRAGPGAPRDPGERGAEPPRWGGPTDPGRRARAGARHPAGPLGADRRGGGTGGAPVGRGRARQVATDRRAPRASLRLTALVARMPLLFLYKKQRSLSADRTPEAGHWLHRREWT